MSRAARWPPANAMPHDPPIRLHDPRRDPPGRLAAMLADALPLRSAVVAVGNELCGDDAAGVEIGRRLGLLASLPWKLICAGPAPESFVFKIAGLAPPALLVIDAADFGGAAGQVRLMAADELADVPAATHGPGLAAFLDMFARLCRCPRRVLAIQPARTTPGCPPGAAVRAAIDRVAGAMALLADRLNDANAYRHGTS